MVTCLGSGKIAHADPAEKPNRPRCQPAEAAGAGSNNSSSFVSMRRNRISSLLDDVRVAFGKGNVKAVRYDLAHHVLACW